MSQLFVPSQFVNLTIEQLMPLFSAVLVLFLAIMVFFQNRRSFINILFALFSFFISFWLFGTFMMFISKTAELQIFWDRFIYLNVIFLPMLLYQFGATFAKVKLKKRTLILGYLATAFFLVISRTNYFISDLFIYKWGVHTKAQFFHHIFLIFFFIFIVRGLLYLREYSKKAEKKEDRIRAKYSFYAFAFLMIGSLGYLPAYGIGIYPFGYLMGTIFVLILTYNITRYQLFNLKAVAAEFFILLLTLFFLFQIFTIDNTQTRIIYGVLFIITLAFGFLFIKGAITEINQREKLEKLTAELQDLNQNLEQKVAAQTQEVRQAYEVEKKARVELQELDKAKDQFILATQHHLRTPLTIIKGYLQQFLLKKAAPVDEEGRLFLEKASTATDRISALINELLDVSQMQVGKSILRREAVNLRTLVEDIFDEISSEVTKKHLKLSLVFSPKKEDNIVSADKEKVKEALTNLVDNAVKYNQEGGEIKVKGEKFSHPIEKDRKFYRLTIADTGIGIPPEELPRLLTQYFQRGKEAQKIYTTGRGIGLAVTKNIIQAHQGRIYAESDGRGRGAKFIVELPV